MPQGAPSSGADAGPPTSHAHRHESHPDVVLHTALVEADHWRRVARQRTEALDSLQRRPLVRLVVRLDRRSLPIRRRLKHLGSSAATNGSRTRVLAAGLRTRRQVDRRDARLRAAADSLGPPPAVDRQISLIVAPRSKPGPSISHPGAGVEVVVLESGDEAPASAVRRAIEASPQPLVCIIAPTSRPLEEGWLARLAAPMTDDVVAAVPLLVHPARATIRSTPDDLLVRSAGLEFVDVDGVPEVVARDSGAEVDVSGAPSVVDAGSAACVLVDRKAYDEVGGLASDLDLDVAVIDLCARLRARGDRIVVVPSAVVEDGRRVLTMQQLRRPLPPAALRSLIDQRGADLLRIASPHPGVRIACSVAASSHKVARRWGDWHVADALASSLRRLGHEVLVQIAPESDDPAGRCCDVHVVVRGLAAVRRTPGQRHVLWIISHPEAVETSELDEADVVLVASERFATALRQRTATPVEVLLQATDHRRFRPRPVDPAHDHPVTVVAKTREMLRPIVRDAIAAGLRPAIYGGGWEGFVDPELVVADFVANDELPAVYSSAGVVLNDHWETMRAWGFVSNRLFDVLACGRPVVSDHLPEISALFGDAIPTYRTPDDLGATVRDILANPEAARVRAASGQREVLEHHTFDHRAGQLLELLVSHGLVDGGLVTLAGAATDADQGATKPSESSS